MKKEKIYSLIEKDKLKLEALNDKIHEWLLKNRKGYNAEKWADIIENNSLPGEFAIPIPNDDNALSAIDDGLVKINKGKLEDKWFKKMII